LSGNRTQQQKKRKKEKKEKKKKNNGKEKIYMKKNPYVGGEGALSERAIFK